MEGESWLGTYGWALLVVAVMLFALAYFYDNQPLEPVCEDIQFNTIMAEYTDDTIYRFDIRQGVEKVVPLNVKHDGRIYELKLVWVEDYHFVRMCKR